MREKTGERKRQNLTKIWDEKQNIEENHRKYTVKMR